MKYIKLKDTDLNLSNICLGTGNFGASINKEQAFCVLDEFVRQGGNFIDTANVYCRWISGNGNSAERFLGEWLKSRGAYQDVVIATKGAHYDMAKPEVSRVTEEDIRLDLEDSLKTMCLDTIDFYWLHRDDENKPIEEIIDILEGLKKEGKIRYYGLSNYKKERLDRARKYLSEQAKKGPYAVSNQWSLASVNKGKNMNPDPTIVQMDEELYQWHKVTETPLVPFTSTAQGFFEKLKNAGVQVKDGKLISPADSAVLSEPLKAAYWNEENLKIYEKLLKIQRETGHSLHALSVAWLYLQPFQTWGLGSVRNVEQLRELIKASEIELEW